MEKIIDKKIINKKILTIVTLCVLLIVPFLKFFSMNLEAFGVIRSYDYINPAIVLYVCIPFLIFVYIKDIIDKKRKIDIYDYLFYILIITGIISVIFSIDIKLALFGKTYRHEGFLTILSYYLLFINWKINGTKEDIKKFLKLLVIIAILNSIYVLFQIYTPFKFIIRYAPDKKMASGLCGNPNFLGTLISTALGMVVCKFLINKKISFKEIILIILLSVALINAQSTGPILAFILLIIFLIVLFIIKKQLILKNVLILIIVLAVTYTSVYYINRIGYKSERCEMCNAEIEQTVSTGGNGRLDIWKNSLDIVKKYPIAGVGFDNFYLAYPNPEIPSTFTYIITNDVVQKRENYILIYDNAHNVYLHTLVSTGFLGLIPYLLLCLLTFIKGLKFKSKFGLILLSGFVVYSLQAFGNINVIQVAPIYYIIIGLILSIKEEPI